MRQKVNKTLLIRVHVKTLRIGGHDQSTKLLHSSTCTNENNFKQPSFHASMSVKLQTSREEIRRRNVQISTYLGNKQ